MPEMRSLAHTILPASSAIAPRPAPPSPSVATQPPPEPMALVPTRIQPGGLIAGPQGRHGGDGKDGRGVDDAYIDANGHLILILSDGATKDTGAVSGSGASGSDGGVAAIAIGGHKVVRASGGYLYPASNADPSQIGTVIGLSVAAAAAGATLSYKVEGLVTEPSWNFAPGPVYLGVDGGLTQTVPATGFIQQIGVVQAPTQVSIQIYPPLLIG